MVAESEVPGFVEAKLSTELRKQKSCREVVQRELVD